MNTEFKPRIKHYIFTRFSNIYACKLMPEEDFFSENRLQKKLEIYKTLTYPSLVSQSNQNFINLVMIHDEIPNNIYNELVFLSSKYKNIRIIKNSEIGDYSNNNYIRKDLDVNNYDFLITSRFDDDDMLYKNAIEDIQNTVNVDTLIKYTGFKNGCTLDYNTKELYKFDRNSSNGMVSIGISMIQNIKKYSILPFNIYWGKHSSMRLDFLEKKIETINKIHPLKEHYIDSKDFWDPIETDFPAWVYTRHDEAKSAFIPGRFEKKFHYSKIPIQKDLINEKFFKVF